MPIGVVVDAVSEVLNVKAEDIDDTPSFGVSMETNSICGVVKMSGGVKMLLDTDRLLSETETEMLANVY